MVPHIPYRLRAERPSISFEFFPPKDDGSEAQLWEAIRHLERIRPDFVSVTYGAGGTTQDRTIRVTERIARETSLVPLAHLTCVGATVPQLRRVVGAYAAAGIRNILALRGDPPGNVGGEWLATEGGLSHADELVELIRGLGDFTIGVAAFPDIHPSSPGLDHDIEVLVRKADAGASFAVTQMVFDADTLTNAAIEHVGKGFSCANDAQGLLTPFVERYLRYAHDVMPDQPLEMWASCRRPTSGRSSGCRSSWGRPCRRPWCRGSRRSVRMRPRCAQWVWRSPRSWLSGCSARARRGCTSSR